MVEVAVPVGQIHDWDSFHSVLAAALLFPEYYGRNSNAFDDALWGVAHGYDGPPRKPGEAITLVLSDVEAFRARCPEQFEFLVDAVAFVNTMLVDEDFVDEPLPVRISLAYR